MKEKIGWALIIIGVLFPIVATVVFFTEPSSMPLAAKIGFLCRFWVTAPVVSGLGAGLVVSARRKRLQEKFNETINANYREFQATFCAHCRFADKEALKEAMEGRQKEGQKLCKADKDSKIPKFKITDEWKTICHYFESEGAKAKEKAKGDD